MIQPEVDADRHGEGGDHRKHQRGGEDPRDDEVGVAVVGQGLERVHLLGHLHRAELGGDAGAHAAGERHAR